MKSNQLAIIIPVYNEADIVANVIGDWEKELGKYPINFAVHVYNDGSKDNTLCILTELAANRVWLHVHNKLNSGHGPSVSAGYRENIEECEWIFQVDSDNEISAGEFIKLWNSKDGSDIIVGRRHNREQNLPRKIISMLSRLAVKIFYKSAIFDVNSPYRLFRSNEFKNVVCSLPVDTLTPNVILSGMAGLRGMRCKEIPVIHQNRKTGQTTNLIKILRMSVMAFWQVAIFRFRFKE